MDFVMQTPVTKPSTWAWDFSSSRSAAAGPETPSPLARPKPHAIDAFETPKKKLKFSGGEVEQHVQIVNNALAHLKLRSKPCKELLKDITFFSLGPMEGERHELQTDASKIIGPELEGLETQDKHRIRELERLIAEKKGMLEQLIQSESHAESERASKQNAISHQQRVISDASAQVQDAFAILQAAAERKRKYEMEMRTIEKIKQEVEDLKTKHFDPLNSNESTSHTLGNPTAVNHHIDKVKGFLVGPHSDWGKYREAFCGIIKCEGALLTSFCQAASHYRSERGEVCIEAMEGVEGVEPKLLSLLQKAVAEYTQMHQQLESFRIEVTQAEAAHTTAQKVLDLAKDAFTALEHELKQIMQRLAQTKKTILDFQEEIRRLEAELAGLQTDDEQRILELEALIAKRSKELEQQRICASQSEMETSSKKQAISRQESAINGANCLVQETSRNLQAAAERKRKYELEMRTIEKIKQEVEDLKTKHFDPLNSNESTSHTLGNPTAVNHHIDKVKGFLVGPHSDWGKYREAFCGIIKCEGALLTSFCQAASHYRSERGEVCIEAMEGVEGVEPKLLSLLQKATSECAQMHQHLGSLDEEVQRAESAHTNAQNELTLARQALAVIKDELEEAMQRLAPVKKAVRDLEAEIRRLEDELARLRSRSLRSLSIAALASYRWLMSHQVGGYASPELNKNHLSTYTPAVQDKIRIVSQGLSSMKMLPTNCTNLLLSCVLHGLGPVPNDRGDPQGTVSQLVGKALRLKEAQLQYDVTEQMPPVGSINMTLTSSMAEIREILLQAGTDTDKARASKETAVGVSAEIVRVKETDLNQLQSKQNGLNQSLERARHELNVAQEKWRTKSLQASEANDRYQDFCALKKGVSKTESERLLGPFPKFFKTIPSEESLVKGFWLSARETPEERGVICHDIMAHVQSDIVSFKDRLASEESDLEVIRQDRSENVKRLEQELMSLKEQIRCANAEVTAAKDLSMKVRELDTFRSEIMSAYQWLLLRPMMAT